MLKTIMLFMNRSRPAPMRFARFWLISSAFLAFWTVAVFQYGSYNWAFWKSGVWYPPLNWKYQIEHLIAAWREHIVIVLGILFLSFMPFVLRIVRRQARAWDLSWLVLALLGIYAVFTWDMYTLDAAWFAETHGDHLGYERGSYGFLFVLLAGLLGGSRIGFGFGLLNLLVQGWLFQVINLPNEPLLRTVLQQLWGVVGVWAGLSCGYWREHRKLELRPLPLFATAIGLEVLAICLTLPTTWIAPYHFDRFTHNLLSTAPLLAMLGAWLQYQASNDPRALKRTQAELALLEAELRALRAQMNPHFLMNSLSVIHHLVRTNPEQARELLLDLSDVLNHTLRTGDFVSLAQEIEQTKSYLALEQARYTGRLTVDWQIPESLNLNCLVPTLTLQPLVENAVRHGIAPRPEGGTVTIALLEEFKALTIRVTDDGVGFKPLKTRETETHIGLNNISERLRLLYGAQYGLQLDSRLEQGTIATLRLPLDNQMAEAKQLEPKWVNP
jgi:anti-sigma regulatory factor (Ser/Thr protein kinase)